ncbi:magnesium transporter CorA family protein, partial [Actinoalloteichus spitiensis]|uniref:magnesium transporter CorA family protein n=1 Tax=Actinoalloteichus spitiensis TaxID=252394 RepID=UPI00036F42E8
GPTAPAGSGAGAGDAGERAEPDGRSPAAGGQGDGTDRIHLSEVDVFVTANALVTVRRSPGLDLDRLRERWDTGPGREGQTVDSLLYGLLDVVVDGHFDVVQSFDDRLEELEAMLFEEHTDMRRAQRVAFRTRKDMLAVRRVVLPMREVLSGVMRDPGGIVGGRMTPYYQDVYDHVLRATEWLEGVRELASTLRETQLALQGNRLNVVMKKVTSWAAIIAAPTAITGFYGQNLPYPGYLDHGGFATSSILIVVTSVALYLLFTRRGWL